MTTASPQRFNSIDILRGLVMVIMALDHSRDFLHIGAFTGDPLDAETTTAGLYFTRWITHFCAPVFVFLAGTSIYLQSLRKSSKELSLFLLKRGLWLILVEILIVTFSFTYDIHMKVIIFQVIWAIGISMVCMAALVFLPYYWILAIGLLIFCGHNLLDYAEAQHQGTFPFLWDLAHHGFFKLYPIPTGRKLMILYPFLPWTGIMMLGYALGRLFEAKILPAQRRKWLLTLGLASIALFFLLRTLNAYGDPNHWQGRDTFLKTVFAFFDVTKYPPSIMYACITLGPALVFLAFIEPANNRITAFFNVYGKVPFFYYVIHFYILHTICMVLFFWRGHTFDEGIQGVPGLPFKFFAVGEGYSLPIVYLIWIGVVLLLYPACRWFGAYKQKNKKWWLSYL